MADPLPFAELIALSDRLARYPILYVTITEPVPVITSDDIIHAFQSQSVTIIELGARVFMAQLNYPIPVFHTEAQHIPQQVIPIPVNTIDAIAQAWHWWQDMNVRRPTFDDLPPGHPDRVADQRWGYIAQLNTLRGFLTLALSYAIIRHQGHPAIKQRVIDLDMLGLLVGSDSFGQFDEQKVNDARRLVGLEPYVAAADDTSDEGALDDEGEDEDEE